jgi:hypothetical protein
MAAEMPDSADESRAAHVFRAETRHSTVSTWRKLRSFVANLAASAFSGPVSWPPVDVVLVDIATGAVVRRWHEGGEEAAGLLRLLNDDLSAMGADEFIDKWDVPVA